MGRLRWQSSSSRKVLMVGGSGRTIELTGGEGGGCLRTFFASLAKRYCRLHGSTVSAKSQNLKNQQKCIQNGPKGEPWMRSKRTLRVPWLTGFITLWPCAPKRRKNAPNCVRSVQAKCRGRQKTKNKPRKVHKHPQQLSRNPQNDGKCPGVWAFLRSTNKN